MIRAAAWFCGEHCGIYAPSGGSWEGRSPGFAATGEVPAIVGRPVKYYARMTAETRCSLCAASIAMKFAGWEGEGREIGLLSAGSDGCLKANEEYFRDYVANGRTMGRGNLFIYTLTTSALGELAIALSLKGPSLFWRATGKPIEEIGRIGGQICSDKEAEGMLGLWSDSEAAVCLVIEGREEVTPAGFPWVGGDEKRGDIRPTQLCGELRDLVRRA